MKTFFKKNLYSIIFYILIILAFLAGLAVGSLRSTAEKTEKTDVIYVNAEAEKEAETEAIEHRTSLGEFKITAYCTCTDCCGGYSDGKTATGTDATPGRTIAVDPDVIPYGTVVEINGQEFFAEDCGEAIKGNHIDVLCASHELAQAFGVQNAEVFEIN